MRIEFEGLSATVDVSTATAWDVLRFATDNRTKKDSVSKNSEENTVVVPLQGTEQQYISEAGKGKRKERAAPAQKSNAALVREVARELLADGERHLRRELSAAVRKAGLSTRNLDNTLRGHDDFGWDKDEEGRSVYWLDPWAIPDPPAGNGGATMLGSLGSNGASP
jgi:hypothetical protein